MNSIIRFLRYDVLAMLGLSVLFTLSLVSFRIIQTDSIVFIFLFWNLFLALISLGISQLLVFQKSKINLFSIGLAIVWLLFYPNAAYLITDLVHLKQRTGIPFWYDTMILFSAAFNGLMIAYYSLSQMMEWLELNGHKMLSRIFNVLSIFLCSIGIYIGRFLRWNSWDIFHQPLKIVEDILNLFFSEVTAWGFYGYISVTTIFLWLIFQVLHRQRKASV